MRKFADVWLIVFSVARKLLLTEFQWNHSRKFDVNSGETCAAYTVYQMPPPPDKISQKYYILYPNIISTQIEQCRYLW